MKQCAILLLLISLVSVSVSAQEKFTVQEDLRNNWMIFTNNNYELVDTESRKIKTIYFTLDANKYMEDFLSITSSKPFFLFVNGKLLSEHKGKLLLNIDSLSSLFTSSSLRVALYQATINERDLSTTIVSLNNAVIESLTVKKPDTFFRDFVIVSGLLIIILSVVIFRINPKLASDYFSVARIFSLREADDTQSSARLTSSANIQFYVLSSLLIAFYLLMVMHYLPDEYALPLRFSAIDFLDAFFQWIKLSAIIFVFFLVKLMIVFMLTRLFNMKGMARIHFFNWVRLILVVLGSFAVLLFIYFISRGQHENYFVTFLSLIIVTLGIWVLVAFFKLNAKGEHSMFHLFSYICATEIIPLLITVKVLFQ